MSVPSNPRCDIRRVEFPTCDIRQCAGHRTHWKSLNPRVVMSMPLPMRGWRPAPTCAAPSSRCTCSHCSSAAEPSSCHHPQPASRKSAYNRIANRSDPRPMHPLQCTCPKSIFTPPPRECIQRAPTREGNLRAFVLGSGRRQAAAR